MQYALYGLIRFHVPAWPDTIINDSRKDSVQNIAVFEVTLQTTGDHKLGGFKRNNCGVCMKRNHCASDVCDTTQ